MDGAHASACACNASVQCKFMSNLLEGKLALLTGIANRWSLAYAVAQAFAREGATLVLTYLGERQKEAIEDLSKEMKVAAILPCHQGRRTGGAHRIVARARAPAPRGAAQPGIRQSGRPFAAVRGDVAQRVPADLPGD